MSRQLGRHDYIFSEYRYGDVAIQYGFQTVKIRPLFMH